MPRIYLFAHLRTGSNLFTRLFNHHPDFEQKLYPFLLPGLFGPDRPPNDVGLTVNVPDMHEQVAPLFTEATMQATTAKVQQFMENAESKGKSILIKDHALMLIPYTANKELEKPRLTNGSTVHAAQSNPTSFSDQFMKTLVPIFIVRHPARMVPSLYRAIQKAFKITVDDPVWQDVTKWTTNRQIFDWYLSLYRGRTEGGQVLGNNGKPIVINGDDLITDTRRVMKQVCQIAKIDESGLQYTWKIEKNPYDEWPEAYLPAVYPWFGRIDQSTGIEENPRLLKEPVIEEEARAWAIEFGLEVAKRLVISCEEAMDDYLYLQQFCLKRAA